ncbi:MAG: hypothetical protein ACR2OY_05890 [Boseongicola sp.]
MTPENRTKLLVARTGNYNDIMRTTVFTLLGIAAVVHFGDGSYSAPLTVLTVVAALYGILAGGVALDDIMALRDDLDEASAATSYGNLVQARNIGALKMTSTVLIGIAGFATLYALIT